MIAPVEVKQRTARAGLGVTSVADVEIHSGDSYKDIIRKKAAARFEALQ